MNHSHRQSKRAYIIAFLLLVGILVAPARAQRGPTPLERATEMKKARATASQVAVEMQRAFRQSPEQIAGILQRVGYRANESAPALVTDLRISGDQVAHYLLLARYAAPDVAVGLIPYRSRGAARRGDGGGDHRGVAGRGLFGFRSPAGRGYRVQSDGRLDPGDHATGV